MTPEIPLIACRPVRPEDYPPDRFKLWQSVIDDMEARGEPTPPIYPGSTYVDCEVCGVQVAVGPRGQQAMRVKGAVVCCLLCAVTETVQPNVSARVASLGNPFVKRKP